MKFRVNKYISPSLFNDEEEHLVLLDNLNLASNTLQKFTIGVDTAVSSALILKSHWAWMYDTNASSSSTTINTIRYNCFSSMPSGVSTNKMYKLDGSQVIDSAIILYSVTDQNCKVMRLDSITFNSYSSISITPTIPKPLPIRYYNALAIRFKDERLFNLPSSLYSVSSGKLTWVKSHPLCQLLYGIDCFA